MKKSILLSNNYAIKGKLLKKRLQPNQLIICVDDNVMIMLADTANNKLSHLKNVRKMYFLSAQLKGNFIIVSPWKRDKIEYF